MSDRYYNPLYLMLAIITLLLGKLFRSREDD